MTPAPAGQAEVAAIAADIARSGAAEDAHVFHLSWWSERMLDWAMSHPAFKTQLFRLVDVFPACHDDRDVMRHLEEYFEGVDMPKALDFGLDAADHVPFGARVTASVARRNILKMAQQFIAGEDAASALPRLAELWAAGEAFTVDLLGEKTVTLAEADAYAARVMEMVEVLAEGTAGWPVHEHLERDPWGVVPRVNVSVKPTALAPLLAPLTRDEGLAQAEARLVPVLERAREVGATVHLDMEHDDVKDLTLELLRRLGARFSDGPHLGAVIQAYRRDSFPDLEDLCAWSATTLAVPLQVRLVKGAYWDFERLVAGAHDWPSPVYDHKAETDANAERCIDLLLDRAGDVRPAVASHNLRTIAYAVAGARERGLSDAALELQLLYGMAEPVHAGLRAMGRRVRVYAPVGALVPGMAYLVRRLLENTSNESFVRMRFAEGADLDALLEPPQVPTPVEEEPDPAAFRHEPPLELRRLSARAQMGAAVNAVPSSFGFEAPLLVDGAEGRTGRWIESVDPGDIATVVCRAAVASTEDADRAVECALTGMGEWAAAVLFRAAALMRERRADLAALEVFEAGKPWAEADADVCEAVDFLEYYGRQAVALAEGKPVESPPGEANAYHYVPRGVGAVITPWNFPLAIPTGMVAAPLAVGNAVVFKPAEQAPGVGFRLAQILLEAGVPPAVLAYLPGLGEEVGAHLVGHPDIAFVSFTGSKAVGLEIVARAAEHRPGQRHVKRVVAEMGGKNAVIVDSDADLDVAVPAIVQSAFGYAGQKCSACSRVLVARSVLDAFLDRLVGAVELVPVGHPKEMGTVVGPLIDGDAARRLAEYRGLARQEGEVVVERDDVPSDGFYVGPSVVVAPATSRVATEEIFGPLLTVTAVDSFDEALALANASQYALTAGIFSRSPSHIARAARELRAGNVYVNRGITGAVVGRQPFGGMGLSGVGSKAGGPDSLLQFVEPRVVTENTIRQGFAPEH